MTGKPARNLGFKPFRSPLAIASAGDHPSKSDDGIDDFAEPVL
jgi:hypothetical protein